MGRLNSKGIKREIGQLGSTAIIEARDDDSLSQKGSNRNAMKQMDLGYILEEEKP